MTKAVHKNIAASVHQRLLNKARETDRPFNELLQYYAMERFLYRLAESPYSKRFILKGALMLMVWGSPVSRPTMDIDLLGKMGNSIEAIVSMVRELCRLEDLSDGMVFDPESVRGERITEDADYEGVRVRFRGSLATAQMVIQLDIGFGDIVIPPPKLATYPTILDYPAPQMRAYSKESTIAEKFEAMVKLGVMNSRMKDFWDIWLLSRQYSFAGRTLAEAIIKTFSARKTELPADPIAFTPAFARDERKAFQWKAFLRKNRLVVVPENFEEVVQTVSAFLKPIIVSIVNNQPVPGRWNTRGVWQDGGAYDVEIVDYH